MLCTACGVSAAAAAAAAPPAAIGAAAGAAAAGAAAYCTDGVEVHACVGRTSPLMLT